MLLLVIVGVSLLLILKYKKKLHSVKEELNYVTYTVERGSSCGSTSHYAAPSESGCSGLSVTPNLKSSNVVHVVNQLKSDPNKVSNIEKAAALKKAIELEKDHPLMGAMAKSPSSAKQLFKPTANPNVYCSNTLKSDKEPIYEELPEVPEIDGSSSTASTSDESDVDVNDLSGSSLYDRPRALNTLNIKPPGNNSKNGQQEPNTSTNTNTNTNTTTKYANSSSTNSTNSPNSPLASTSGALSHEDERQSISCQLPPIVPTRPAPLAPDTRSPSSTSSTSYNRVTNDSFYSNE